MIRRTRPGWLFASLTAVVLVAAQTPLARAQTTVTNLRLNGKTAIATFDSVDPNDPCITYHVAVVSSNSMQQVSPGSTKTTTVGTVLAVDVEDICLDMTVFNGTGATTQQTLMFADLKSATLTATVTITDPSSGQTADFIVNLTWSAAGPATNSRDVQIIIDRQLGLIMVLRQRGSSVPAMATGTVILEDLGLNITPEPSDTAELQSQTQGQLTIQMK
jgi:hypothetical protein